jgi:hypothetical protein
MVACGAPSAKLVRQRTIFSPGFDGKREKSIYSENVLRYSENALAEIRAT